MYACTRATVQESSRSGLTGAVPCTSEGLLAVGNNLTAGQRLIAPGGLDVVQEVAPGLGGRVRDDVAAGYHGRQVVVLRLRQIAPHDNHLLTRQACLCLMQ